MPNMVILMKIPQVKYNKRTWMSIFNLTSSLLFSYQMVSSDCPLQKQLSSLGLEEPDRPSGILLLQHQQVLHTEQIQTPLAPCTNNWKKDISKQYKWKASWVNPAFMIYPRAACTNKDLKPTMLLITSWFKYRCV